MSEVSRYWLITALNIGAGVTLLLMFLDRSPVTRTPLADYGAFYGGLMVSIAVPVGFVVGFILRLISGRPANRRRRFYFVGSYAFLTIVWFMTATPAMFLIAVLQPWPLSLQQGPDTEDARAGFQRTFGFEAPATVSDIYYRRVGLMGEATHTLRFRFDEPEVVDSIIERLELVPVTQREREGALAGFLQVRDSSLSWWPAEWVNATDQTYADQGTIDFAQGASTESLSIWTRRTLWLDSAGQTVFYEEHRE